MVKDVHVINLHSVNIVSRKKRRRVLFHKVNFSLSWFRALSKTILHVFASNICTLYCIINDTKLEDTLSSTVVGYCFKLNTWTESFYSLNEDIEL